MDLEPREELISAYLDDELSPEERAQVESWLAANPQMRQLRDELAAVRASMQALAKHKLDRDLAPAVLRRAERTVLSEPALSAAKAAENGAQARSPYVESATAIGSWWQRGAGWRRMIWPAAALAAALAILVYDRGQNVREVAQAPEEGAPARVNAPASSASDGAVRQEGLAKDQVEQGGEARQKSNVQPFGVDSETGKPASDQRPADSYFRKPQLRAMPRQADPQTQPGQADELSAPASPPPPAQAAPMDLGVQAPEATRFAYVPTEYEIDVTPEYLASGAFDKLLADKNISRVQSLALRQLRQKSANEKQTASTPGDFEIEATGQQIDELLAALKNTEGVKNVAQPPAVGALMKRSNARPINNKPQGAVPLEVQLEAGKKPAESARADKEKLNELQLRQTPATRQALPDNLQARPNQQTPAADVKVLVRFRLRTGQEAAGKPAAPPARQNPSESKAPAPSSPPAEPPSKEAPATTDEPPPPSEAVPQP